MRPSVDWLVMLWPKSVKYGVLRIQSDLVRNKEEGARGKELKGEKRDKEEGMKEEGEKKNEKDGETK